jgi:hypothetical protein
VRGQDACRRSIELPFDGWHCCTSLQYGALMAWIPQLAEPNVDAPGDTTRTNPVRTALRTALRRLVLGAFSCAVAMIALLISTVVLSVTGLSFDPHGYGMIFGILLAVVLNPVAWMLWVLYRSLRRGADRPAHSLQKKSSMDEAPESPRSSQAWGGRAGL